MRIDRFLSHHTGRTRKDASALVRRGRVAVDGVVVRSASEHVDPATQTIAIDGVAVPWVARRVLMMNKPAGHVTAHHDPLAPTVFDLVPAHLAKHLVAIGRLDKDTTGLLLLTDDGQLVHALTHPRRGVDKTYEVTYDGTLVDAAARMAEGLVLDDGTRCRPARFEAVEPGRARVIVHEGRFHQVKRMIAALGGRVVALHRSAVGALTLDPALAPGASRLLDDDELAALSP